MTRNIKSIFQIFRRCPASYQIIWNVPKIMYLYLFTDLIISTHYAYTASTNWYCTGLRNNSFYHRDLSITFQCHKHFRDNASEIKTVVTGGNARLPLYKMSSCFWTRTPTLLIRNKKFVPLWLSASVSRVRSLITYEVTNIHDGDIHNETVRAVERTPLTY